MGRRYKLRWHSVGLKQYGLKKEYDGFRRQRQRKMRARKKLCRNLKDQIQALFDKFDFSPVKKVREKNILQNCSELTNLFQKCKM